jgi:hypothetical protein
MVCFPRLFAAAAVTVLVAAGCGTASHTRTTTRPAGKFPVVVVHPSVRASGIPTAALPRMRGNRAVLLAPSSVAFMTSGSITCAWWPARLTVLDPSAIRIDMRVNGRVSRCGSGAVGFPIAVKLPLAVDVHQPVKVRLAYKVRLPGGGGVSRRSYTSVAPAISPP